MHPPTPLATAGARPVLVCLGGAHTAGKTTVGKTLKQRGFAYYPELGDILRENQTAHSFNQGMRANESWDDFVFRKERERDYKILKEHNLVRDGSVIFVETWHIQNLAWSAFRARLREKCESIQGWKAEEACHESNFFKAFDENYASKTRQLLSKQYPKEVGDFLKHYEEALENVRYALERYRKVCFIDLKIDSETRQRREKKYSSTTSPVDHEGGEKEACRLDAENSFYTESFVKCLRSSSDVAASKLQYISIKNDEDGADVVEVVASKVMYVAESLLSK